MRILAIAIAILGLGVGLPRLARAQSDFSESNQSSDNSSAGSDNSSAGSNDSSANSNDSSANSNESSANSNNSSESNSEQSSDNSTRASSEGTSDGSVESSQQPGVRVLSLVAAITVVAGIGVGVGFWIWSSVRDDREEEAAVKVQAYMRRNHGQLVQEVALGSGPLLDALYDDIGLTPTEVRAVATRLEGSPEQTEMLLALDGEVSASSARRFSVALMRVTADGVGTERMVELMRRGGARELVARP